MTLRKVVFMIYGSLDHGFIEAIVGPMFSGKSE